MTSSLTVCGVFMEYHSIFLHFFRLSSHWQLLKIWVIAHEGCLYSIVLFVLVGESVQNAIRSQKSRFFSHYYIHTTHDAIVA